MATELLMAKRLGVLRPIDPVGQDAIAELPEEVIVKVAYTQPRSLPALRWFFAMLGVVFRAQSYFPTVADLREEITIAAGHYRLTTLMDGRTAVKAKSIAFSQMDETEFQQFTAKVIQVVCERILPNVDEGDLRREIENMIGIAA